MEILLFRTWLTNIGNGFIDAGARAILNKSFPSAKIVEASGFPGHAKYTYSARTAQVEDLFTSNNNVLNTISISDLVDPDMVVLPGCILYEHGLEPFREHLISYSKDDIPIVLLGVGGGNYEKETQRYVTKALNEIRPELLITRDNLAFKYYSDTAINSRRGLDCAFFIDEYYSPPDTAKTFVSHTFDKIEEPEIDLENRDGLVVRPNHSPFGFTQPYSSVLNKTFGRLRSIEEYQRKNLFISDKIEDYLFIYKNSKITRSDRIHACLPSLVYGNQAAFYYETPRARLFDSAREKKILTGDIGNEIVRINRKRLEQEKDEIISELKSKISFN